MLGMIGTQDMILFFVLVLLLFGAKKLPELARGVGKAMGEFKKARDEFEREITHAVSQAENEVVKAPAPTAIPAPATVPTPVAVPASATVPTTVEVAAVPVTAPATAAAPAPTHDPHVS